MVIELHPATEVPAPAVALCAVCGHDDDAHDTTGKRYCAATGAGGLSRTCICAFR